MEVVSVNYRRDTIDNCKQNITGKDILSLNMSEEKSEKALQIRRDTA
jgi:hypothetical protein